MSDQPSAASAQRRAATGPWTLGLDVVQSPARPGSCHSIYMVVEVGGSPLRSLPGQAKGRGGDLIPKQGALACPPMPQRVLASSQSQARGLLDCFPGLQRVKMGTWGWDSYQSAGEWCLHQQIGNMEGGTCLEAHQSFRRGHQLRPVGR